MTFLQRCSRPYLGIFVATFLIAFAFAAYTGHAWEDYYITFRLSKNLATGHGLVFNHGDRLHTFTSPLGVLLPALSSVLTFNKSDAAALWLFRLMCIAAFAGATTLLYACLSHLHRNVSAAALAAAFLAVDAKSVDFTINGMETGILLFFVALTLWAQFGACSRRWLWLGIAWGGLMWTRPDGFLYIGLLAAGGWLFNKPQESGLTRVQWLKLFACAGLLCAAIYLPWFIGSWLYYGTPIPQTVTAKSLVTSGDKSLLGAAKFLVQFPYKIWTTGASSAPDAFLPAYYMLGGWPNILVAVAKALGFVAAFSWLVPRLASSARAASFAFCGLHVYLSYYPYFPFPWYLPGTVILAFFVLGSIIAQLAATANTRVSPAQPNVVAASAWKKPVVILSVAFLALNLWTLPAVARQLAQQQTWIENGTRRKIGEWLAHEAHAGDTVFLEPLGYIGYFSNLKTYDFPGLSSREMTRAIRAVGTEWSALIKELSPDWLVLRPREVEKIEREKPSLLSTYYTLAKRFDVFDELQSSDIRGRGYLESDARFVVFHREDLKLVPSTLGKAYSRFPVSAVGLGGRSMELVHAPSRVVIKIPKGAQHVTVPFGMLPGSYEADPKTDGAMFEVDWESGRSHQVLSSRAIDPANRESDRGVQIFELDLPRTEEDAELILKTESGVGWVKDWTCWTKPEFR